MKRIMVIITILCNIALLNAQWEWINPTPPNATFSSVVHITGEKYMAAGGPAIMMTNNSGTSWAQIVLDGQFYLKCIFFVDEETGYAGGYDGALLKSTDGGYNWETLDCGIDDELNSIYFVNRDTGYIAAEYGAVLKTTDGGDTWVRKTVSGEYSDLFTIKFFNDSIGYASGDNGVFWKTVDGGENWTVRDLDFWDVYDLSLLDENTIISASDDGIHKSNDGGQNWSLVHQPGENPVQWTVYRLCFVDGQTGYATGGLNEIYKTTNGGDDWTVITAPDNIELYGFVMGIAFESANKGIIGDNACFYTIDPGTNTWTQYKKSFTDKKLEAVAYANDTTVFVVGANIIARSKTNGRTWAEIEGNSIVGAFYDIIFLDASTAYIVGATNSFPGDNYGVVLKSSDGGNNWDMVYNPPARLSGIHFPSIETGYAVGINSQVFKTNDAGTTWSSVNTGIDVNLTSVYFINDTVGLTCGASGKIYKTVDGGITWELKNSTVTYYLADILFLNDTLGFVVGGGKTIIRTTNAGETWHQVIPSGVRPILTLYSIYFRNPDEGYVVGERGLLYITTDGGETWELDNLPFYDYVNTVVTGNENTLIVVARFGSVLRKYTGPEESPLEQEEENGGNNDPGTPDKPVNPTDINLVNKEGKVNMFPNPFNSQLSIYLPFTDIGPVTVEIFDIAGKKVWSAQQTHTPGSVLNVDTGNLKNGVYIVRVQHENKTQQVRTIKQNNH